MLSISAEEVKEIDKVVNIINSKQALIDKRVSQICKRIEERQIKNMLEEIGITDGDFDLKEEKEDN